jgi:c-di-GMP-binding flagellar brake protein YcgR
MNSILKKILLFVAMLNVTAFATAADDENVLETFGQSISRALNRYSLETIYLLIAGTLLLIVFAVFYELNRSNKIKREIWALAMAKFDFHADKLNLRLGSATILKRIVLKTGLQEPSSILKFSHVFEDTLEKYYEIEKIESISNETLMQISALRKALGFSPLPRGIALSSTRQFCSGDECLVQIPETDPPTHKGMCRVLDSDERRWFIVRPEGPPVEAGTWVRMSLTRQGDAEYAFRTQVLGDSDEELTLSHTSKMDRTQQRNWLRVNVNIPVKATLMEETRMGDVVPGKIIDISGGGLGMTLPVKLSDNSTLLLNFELPGQGKIVDLLVKVVRVTGPFSESSPKILHSVAFAGGADLPHDKIIQYVCEKQREDILIKRTWESEYPDEVAIAK